MHGISFELILCAIVSLIFGVIAIYIDFYQIIQKKIPFVPRQVFSSVSLFMLALIVGLMAAAMFILTPDQPGQTGTYVDVVFGSQISNRFARSLYTGAAVLAILRSKLFDLKKAGFGFDWGYAQIKSRIIPGMLSNWWAWRDQWLDRAVPQSFAINQFDKRLTERFLQILATDEDGSKTDVKGQFDDLMRRTPTSAPTGTDPAWSDHRRALCQLALESCGDRVFKGIISV